MLVFEIMPFSVPASSPMLRLISVFLVQVFLLRIFTLLEQVLPLACEHWPMFGKGVGMGGAGGAGTLHTSGKDWHTPPPFVVAENIVRSPLRQVNTLALDLHSIARLQERVLAHELRRLLRDEPQPARPRLGEAGDLPVHVP